MEEQASFEARAVLAPSRARRTRLALLVPVLALLAIAFAGLTGERPAPATVVAPAPTADVGPSLAGGEAAPSSAPETPGPPRPAEVFGLDVHRLDDLQPGGHGRDEIFVVTGWYAPTAITDCPELAALYRDGALPYVRGDRDKLAFCVRSGVLYASRPDVGDDRFENAGLPKIPATFVVGVIVPLAIETIGADPTEVVVIGRFVESGAACQALGGCRPELLIDYVAWTAGA